MRVGTYLWGTVWPGTVSRRITRQVGSLGLLYGFGQGFGMCVMEHGYDFSCMASGLGHGGVFLMGLHCTTCYSQVCFLIKKIKPHLSDA